MEEKDMSGITKEKNTLPQGMDEFINSETFKTTYPIITKEMELLKNYLEEKNIIRRVSIREILMELFHSDSNSEIITYLLNDNEQMIENIIKNFNDIFYMGYRKFIKDILISLKRGGNNCSCKNCEEGCSGRSCLNDKINGMSSRNSYVITPTNGNQKEYEELRKKLFSEMVFFINEVKNRGGSNVSFDDVCLQYYIDNNCYPSIYELFYNETEDAFKYCISIMEEAFFVNVKSCENVLLSMKDLNFNDGNIIEKPCSLLHEKEIENNLEAVIAGGDILCEGKGFDDDKNISSNDEEKEGNMSITDMLINIAGFENGDALEEFICSRLEHYVEETGIDEIPICDMDTIVNSFFDMHVDAMKEFGKTWDEMCQKWVDKKYLYFNKTKTAVMVTDPETPELYLEDQDKIFTDNQEENERIVDELAELYGINLRPFILFQGGQPHMIIEDGTIENGDCEDDIN
uniref:DUF4476 domain-containing protein n=1 Tax=Parastrongyloides trichosuri TaxID=131310 RepID=A0A0N4Z0B8_PARTI